MTDARAQVPYEKKDHVARITLDRPEVLNAMDLRTTRNPTASGATWRPTTRCGSRC
jgi:enoyl-CoA hydratase/carnithine racemase